MNQNDLLMSRIIPLTVFILIASMVVAQTPPPGISAQAVVKDKDGLPVVEKEVSIRVTILQEAPGGTVVYQEIHMPETNEHGITSYIIGLGQTQLGVFSQIDWAQGPHFLQTEVDPEGNNDYQLSYTTQLFSHPYAFYAGQAASPGPGDAPGEMRFWDGQDWVMVAPGDEGQILVFANGQPGWATNPATFTCGDDVGFLYRGSQVTYGTMSKNGLCWLDRNLGASQVPTAKNDPLGYGDLFQWGRGDDGHQIRNSGTTSVQSAADHPGHGDFITTSADWRNPQNDGLWQGTNGINNPCPPGWRLPTNDELLAERDTWGTFNADGAFGSALKWPAAGYRSTGGVLSLDGSNGYVYSSTTASTLVRALIYTGSSASSSPLNRASGFSVRCVR